MAITKMNENERINPLKMGFWKYFLKVYKHSSFLILQGLIIAVYLTVSSVLANRMNFVQLTYLNAMVSISYFSQIIGFGISLGVSVYINQNYKNKEKVAFYTKIGLYLTILLGFIFVLLLFIFKDFFLSTLMNIDVAGNYVFYYLIIAYIFLNCIASYIVNILKNLKHFAMTIIISVILGVMLIVGFLLLYLTGNLMVNYIGIVYIVVGAVNVIVGYFILLKHKNIKINLLKLTKFHLDKKEFSTIFYVTFSQVIWQIGYMMTSLFLLKVSALYFNSYAYYENILNIFNNLFFSFIVLTSINITRSLGEKNFDEAYMHGKYSIYGSIVIWVIYAIISLSLIVPINAGINIELVEIASTAIILYVAIHLFRYLVWNLSSYVLIWGGQVKIQFLLEVFSTLYFIMLFLIADQIPQNIYLVYFLLSLDNIIKLPIELLIFKSKTWLININGDKTEKVVPMKNPNINE